jgi:hypothetical protein
VDTVPGWSAIRIKIFLALYTALGWSRNVSIRNEYFNDLVGQRTSTKTQYSESLFGWGHWVSTTILLRPEVRFERSYDRPAYDNYTKKNQLTLAGDLIFFFQ